VTAGKIQMADAFGAYDRVVAFLWGDDLYSNFSALRSRLWMSETRRLLRGFRRKELIESLGSPRLLCRHIRRRLIWLAERQYRDFFRKIRFCAPVIPQDGSLLRKQSGGTFSVLEHNYGSIQLVLGDLYPSLSIAGENVLLGNSATHTNNHLDVLEVLADADLQRSHVYTPLSYADRPPYADIVEEYGSRVLGDSFVSMRGFMDRERYHEVLSSCRYVIFPHHRQQAGGVLRCMLYAGATVFLFKDNPLWDYYTEMGFKLVSLGEFLRNPNLQSFRISDEEAAQNRMLVDQNFSTELVVKRARVMFETILAEGHGNQ
jgi:dTDP-N-acetylfucosamine:lipid II N-acetylfucosaminyltransferase